MTNLLKQAIKLLIILLMKLVLVVWYAYLLTLKVATLKVVELIG